MRQEEKLAFLDTIPFLFLFCKYLPIGKSVGEIFQDNGYRFFVPRKCWNANHSERWKDLENRYSDFKYIDRLHYFVQEHLKEKLEPSIIDKLYDYLEGGNRTDFMNTIEAIRSLRTFEETTPSDEETEIVLLAACIEECKSLDYYCRTIALLGDDVHSRVLANAFDKNIMIPSGQRFQYPMKKCLTLIDFLGSQTSRQLFPVEYVEMMLVNYACLRVFGLEFDFLDRFLERLPIIQAFVRAHGLKAADDCLKSFCDSIRAITINSLVRLTAASYKSLLHRDPRIIGRAATAVAKELRDGYERLLVDIGKKCPRIVSRKTVKHSMVAAEQLIILVTEKAKCLSKCASVN